MHVLPFPTATADQELDILALDLKGRRSQPALRVVTAAERIDKGIPLEAVHRHLILQRALRRAGAKGGAGNLPRAIICSFKIFDDDVRALCVCDERAKSNNRNERQNGFHSCHLLKPVQMDFNLFTVSELNTAFPAGARE
ncbi:MAG: hypothetical protein WDM76_16405 [Limisphaerales bacterium]